MRNQYLYVGGAASLTKSALWPNASQQYSRHRKNIHPWFYLHDKGYILLFVLTLCENFSHLLKYQFTLIVRTDRQNATAEWGEGRRSPCLNECSFSMMWALRQAEFKV